MACASTLRVQGITINSAADAAGALKPLAGNLASTLFGVGLIGAALLAAAILPLSTAYSVCEFTVSEAGLDDEVADASLFYVTYLIVTGVAALIVLLPGAPLIPILVLSQVLNAVLLLPLLAFMYGISRDRDLMGVYTATRPAPRSTWRSSPSSACASRRYSCSASSEPTPDTGPHGYPVLIGVFPISLTVI